MSTKPPRLSIAAVISRFAVVIAWGALVIVFSLLRPETFATTSNFQTIFGSQAVLLILALALLISLNTGEFDLSVAGVMSISLVLVGWLNVTHGWPIGAAVAVALLAGAAVGLVNSFFVVVVGVESIVTTLGTGTFLLGVGVGVNQTIVSGISDTLVNASRTQILGLPLAFYYGVTIAALLWYVMSHTPLGRYMYFVGVNRNVARLSGLRVDAIRTGSLVATSVVAALAGVVFAGTLGSADPNISSQFLLPAFAAVFLGSTTINPGRFNPWGTFVAVYFLITGITGLQMLGLSGWIQNVFYGASLVLAVTLSKLAGRRQALRGARAEAEELSVTPVDTKSHALSTTG